MTLTPKLFHGPLARSRANQLVSGTVDRSFEAEPLKAESARQLVELLNSSPLNPITVLICLDDASSKCTDTLLKALEEPSALVVPVLWTSDLGTVRKTLLSRTEAIWCPGQVVEDIESGDLGRQLAIAVKDRDLITILEVAPKVKQTRLTIEAMVDYLSSDPNPVLWGRLRALLFRKDPSWVALLDACVSAT